MQVFDIHDILPFINSIDRTIKNPNLSFVSNLINSDVDEIDENDNFEDILNFFDNEDEDFVLHNMKCGEEAEKYIKKIMIKKYGNCEKVSAKEGFDFKVILHNRELKLEVKSLQSYNSPFHLTINEINHAKKYLSDYYICFVILPSLEKGIKDVRFLRNPTEILGICIPEKQFNSLNDMCFIFPEKFLIKPNRGLIKSFNNNL